MLLGLLALAFTWLSALWGSKPCSASAVLSPWCCPKRCAGFVRRGYSMYLAGVAVVSLSLCFDTVLDASGVGSVPPSGGSCCLHHQCCSAEHSAGGSAGARLEPGQSLDGWCCLWL